MSANDPKRTLPGWFSDPTKLPPAGLIQTRRHFRCRKSAVMDANTLELLDCYRARLVNELRSHGLCNAMTKMWPYCWTPYC
jgi:hypothetical protein